MKLFLSSIRLIQACANCEANLSDARDRMWEAKSARRLRDTQRVNDYERLGASHIDMAFQAYERIKSLLRQTY